jgi:hypothetical protein
MRVAAGGALSTKSPIATTGNKKCSMQNAAALMLIPDRKQM